MLTRILNELKEHIPFTVFGAFTGILVMILFYRVPSNVAYNIFYILHPAHVFLSALATAAMYGKHQCGDLRDKCPIWTQLLVGYFGSVGIATLSDSVIPYLGEVMLGLPNAEIHIGFIEEWWLINPLAVLGIALAYFWPKTKVPHFSHVLVSTWASLFHILMAMSGVISWFIAFWVFVFLFLAVWIPCCVSDIVFPLLFVRSKK